MCSRTQCTDIYDNTPDLNTRPCFVANIITYVPNSFPKTAQDVECYKNRFRREDFDYYVSSKEAEKVFTEKKTPSSTRGEVLQRYVTQIGDDGFNLEPFLKKIREESFDEDIKESEDKNICPKYLKVAILLNRMESIDPQYNNISYQCNNIDPSFYSVRNVLWRPCWKKRHQARNGTNALGTGTIVAIEDVRAYYEQLRKEEPIKAQAFLYYNEHTFLSSLAPYNALRETLLRSSITEGFVSEFRKKHSNQPVYIAFFDDDTRSFRTQGNRGVLTCYQDYIEQFHKKNGYVPTCLTSGYSISWHQHPFVSLGVALDLQIRRTMAQTFPLAPYYPEPNTIIYVPEGKSTLEKEESFRKSDETNPLEMPTLIQNIVNCRYGGSFIAASQHFGFLTEGDVETAMPSRFLKKRTGARDKKFPNLIKDLSVENVKDIRDIPQSHLWPNDWSDYIQKFLHEDEKEKIVLNDITITKYSRNFIKSIISSVYTHHSPISIFINLPEKSQNYSNFLGFFLYIQENYQQILKRPIDFTYGTNYTKTNKDAKTKANHYLQQNASTIDQVINLIDIALYKKRYGRGIVDCARNCGISEIKIVHDYIRMTHVSSPPRPLELKIVKKEEDKKSLFAAPSPAPVVTRPPVINPLGFPQSQMTEDQIRTEITKMNKEGKTTYAEIGVLLGYPRGNSTGKAAICKFLKGDSSPGLCDKYRQFAKRRTIPFPNLDDH